MSSSRIEYGPPICECGEEAPLRTSWTEDNPGRRFYGCKFYRTPRRHCRFFAWVDLDYPKLAKNVINALLRKIDKLEKANKELVKRKNVMHLGRAFVWGIAIATVGMPLFASFMAMKKK